ncbi:MAG: hypothetical protein AcusKO_42490 [Acuticoccus sp.]
MCLFAGTLTALTALAAGAAQATPAREAPWLAEAAAYRLTLHYGNLTPGAMERDRNGVERALSRRRDPVWRVRSARFQKRGQHRRAASGNRSTRPSRSVRRRDPAHRGADR